MFTPQQLTQMTYEQLKVGETYYQLMGSIRAFVTDKPLSIEHLLHGLLRRLGTLQVSIENVFSICPPDRDDFPSRKELVDLTINPQGVY